MQSVPTVTAWLDRQRPPEPITEVIAVPEGTTTIRVTMSSGGGSGNTWPLNRQPADGRIVIEYVE